MMELPGKESTEFGKGRRDTSGFSFLITAMGANVESDGSLAGEESNPAMNRFTGKPYDEDLQADVFPFRNYSAKLARWTSADPARFPDGPNRHFYAPVPTSGLDPMGLATFIKSTNRSPTKWSPEEWTYGPKEQFFLAGGDHAGSNLARQEAGIKKFTHWEEGYTLNHVSGSVSIDISGASTDGDSFTLGSGGDEINFSYTWATASSDTLSIGGPYDMPHAPDEDHFWAATILIGKGDVVNAYRSALSDEAFDHPDLVPWSSWSYTGIKTNIRAGEYSVKWDYYES